MGFKGISMGFYRIYFQIEMDGIHDQQYDKLKMKDLPTENGNY